MAPQVGREIIRRISAMVFVLVVHRMSRKTDIIFVLEGPKTHIMSIRNLVYIVCQYF